MSTTKSTAHVRSHDYIVVIRLCRPNHIGCSTLVEIFETAEQATARVKEINDK